MKQIHSDNASAQPPITRRKFVQTSACAAVVATGLNAPLIGAVTGKPAVLGGTPVRKGAWPSWPIWDEKDELALREALRSGNWFRYAGNSSTVDQFELEWSRAVGARFCQATNSGTSAMITSLAALGIGPGDEVLIPPYTFPATVNCVLLLHALPVFVDSDPATAQMDPEKIESRINDSTRAILPVHYGGTSCDMDRLMEIARRRDLRVVEDACQAHTGEWRGRRLGTLGDTGCYSFQNSKLLTSGDGGVLVTNHELLYHRAQAFHNNGHGRFKHDGGFTANGGNFRMTQFQGALLLQQLKRLNEQARQRESNVATLDALLPQIEGIRPKKRLKGTTRHGAFAYVFDYDPGKFAGMDKTTLRKAVAAEGVPIDEGYTALNKEPWVERFLSARGFRRIYGEPRLKQWRDENQLPANDRMITTTFRLKQTVLLAEPDEMQNIAAALHRVQRHAADIVRTRAKTG
ncbi:MAG: DegT/DnrJ/EryC1/StrS family aminotransferase [Opitutaceae bacterium]